jgi:hypothetical protein
MFRTLLPICLFASLLLGSGCPSSVSDAPQTATTSETASEAQKSAEPSPTPEETAAVTGAVAVAPFEELPAPPDAPAGESTQESRPPTGKQGIEKTLRSYFAHLALRENDKAEAMMLLSMENCRKVFREKSNCTAILKGQRDAILELQKDPIPFNSKLMDLRMGAAQIIDESRGGIANTPIWIGSHLMARAPNGHDFLLRSLAVIESSDGNWVLWGQRRGLKDTPRNPKAGTPDAKPALPKAP